MPIRINNQNDLAVYRPQGNVNVAAPSAMPSVDLGLSRQGGGARQISETFAKLGQSIHAALKKREEIRDNTDYADAVNQMDGAALRFQNEFSDAKKGRDARGAADLFMRFTKSQAAELAKRFEDRPDLARRVRMYGDALSVKAYGAGQNYEDREENEYRKSVLGSALEKFKATAATGSEAETALEKQKYLATLEELDPGMDHTKERMALDAVEAGSLFDRRLAVGDYKGAEAVLNTRGTALGEHLPAAQLRLNQAKKAAEAEARQRRNEEASRELDVFNSLMFNARLTGDPAEAKDYLKSMAKRGLLTGKQLAAVERQVMGLEADQINLILDEAKVNPDVNLDDVAVRLKDAALPFKFKEKAKLKLAGIQAKRAGAVVADAEKTLDASGIREVLKSENLTPKDRQALESELRMVEIGADAAATDLYAPVPQLRQTVEIIESDMLKRNSDGSSYYDAETLGAMELRRKHAAEQLKALERGYKEDPAGTAVKRLQSGTSPVGSVSGNITEEELAQKILDDQRANGVDEEHLRVVPGGYKAILNKAWKASNFSERVNTAVAFKKKYGRFAEMALREISQGRLENHPDGTAKPYDSTEAETVMAVADNRASVEDAREFLAAYALRGKDVMGAEGKTSQDANAVAEDALKEVLADSESYQHIVSMAHRTMNPQLNSRAKALAETAKILLLQGKTVEDAARILDHGIQSVQADSVTREETSLPLSDPTDASSPNLTEEEDGVHVLPDGSWFSASKEIPFSVQVELPAGHTKEQVLSRISQHGFDAFNHYVSALVEYGAEVDRAQGWEPDESELRLRRARIEEQLLKSGWWGNDNGGSPDILTFYSGTGTRLFDIPLKD